MSSFMCLLPLSSSLLLFVNTFIFILLWFISFPHFFVFIPIIFLIPLWHDGVDGLAELVVRILVLESTGWCDHDAAGRSLCLCSCTESSFGLDVAVRYSFLLAQNGQVSNDINWRNITSNDAESLLILAAALDHFFHTALQCVLYFRCTLDKLQKFFRQRFAGEWRGDGRQCDDRSDNR